MLMLLEISEFKKVL